MKSIYIITGDVHSGKTSLLMDWCKDRENIDGILSPVIDGKRYLKHIKSGELKLLDTEAVENREEKSINDINAFSWGKEILANAFHNCEWLIVDEIGPLELEGKGFEPVIREILNKDLENYIHIMLVVRKSLVQDLINHFNLNKIKINIFDLDV